MESMTGSMSVKDLTALFKEKSITSSDCAHLCVDVQELYADKAIAKHIADHINPVFNQSGVINYLVHFNSVLDEEGMPTGSDSFCEVKPLPGDRLVCKTRASTIGGSNIDTLLKEQKSRLTVVTGFAFGRCVTATAEDAAQYGYCTVILTDGTNKCYGFQSLQEDLEEKGVIFTSSDNLFEALKMK